jgi:hypothetical protein
MNAGARQILHVTEQAPKKINSNGDRNGRPPPVISWDQTIGFVVITALGHCQAAAIAQITGSSVL